MTIIAKTLLSAALIFAASGVFACNYPSHPNNLPDGASASKDEMIAGVKMINEYQTAMSKYLSCIETAHVAATQNTPKDDNDTRKQHKTMFDKKYNAAVDEQTLWVEEFNAQIRAYKARGK